MDFRRNAARRRRVMRDDLIEVDATPTTTSSGQPIARYNIDNVLAHQPLAIDWVPKKPWFVISTVVGIFGLTVFLLAGHYFHVINPTAGQGEQVQTNLLSRIGAQTSLWSLEVAGSFSQLFLLAVGFASLILTYQIYLLRRHRSDDYKGWYQVWLWLIPAVGFYALGNITGLQRLLGLLISDIALLQTPAVSSTILFLLPSLVIAACSIRCFFEIKESTVSTVFLMFAAVLGLLSLGFAAKGPLGLANVPVIANLPNDLPLALWLIASTSFSSCLLFYLSYVHKDVMGLVQHGELGSNQRLSKPSKKERSKSGRTSQAETSPEHLVACPMDVDPTIDDEQAAIAEAMDQEFDHAESPKLSPRRNRRKSA